MANTYEGKINPKSGAPITVTIVANSPQEAKKMLEAQYASIFRSWFIVPHKK